MPSVKKSHFQLKRKINISKRRDDFEHWSKCPGNFGDLSKNARVNRPKLAPDHPDKVGVCFHSRDGSQERSLSLSTVFSSQDLARKCGQCSFTHF